MFLPQTEKRSTDNPPTENQPLLSTDVTKDLNNKEASSIPYSKIIAYLNEQTGKSYKAVGKNNDLIKARWNEGYTLEDFERVIDNKVSHVGRMVVCLCRECHGKIHQGGEKAFFNKHHIVPIKLTEETVKLLNL